MKLFLVVALSVLLLSCSSADEKENTNWNEAVGWMHGNCLAIKNPNIVVPREITLARLDDKTTFTKGVISQKALSEEGCYALFDDRRKVNIDNGYSFYFVQSEKPVNLAIGLIGHPQVGNLSFSYCNSTEGMRFTVSDGSKTLWKGYYYLAYEAGANCR